MDPKKLAILLGLAEDKCNEEGIKEKMLLLQSLEAKVTAAETAKTELAAQVVQLTTEVSAKTEEVKTLNTQIEPLKAQAVLGETTLSAARAEALRLYNTVEGAGATDTMRNLISSSSLEVAQSFQSSYKPRFEAIAPLKCTKCGCAELSRQQSNQSDAPPVEGTKAVSGLQAERVRTAITSIHG